MSNQYRDQRTCKTIEQFNRQCAEQRAKQILDMTKHYQKRVHNYVIDTRNILGEGTFSVVYRGKNIEKGKEVAVKVTELKTIQKMGIKQLFWEQLNIIQQLRHPNIVTCYEYFRTPNNCYTIYEYCQGGDLTSILTKGHLGDKEYLNRANSYIKDIFQGLLYLETMNIIHRDIKAANILINKGKAKIGDFGFATRCKYQFRDASIGSPAYMSPEGLLHNIYGPKTDVWAFGMLLYEILHGVSPFSHCQSQAQLKKSIKIPVSWDQLKATLPSPLKRLILKCLKVPVQQRPKFSDLLTDEYIQKLYQPESFSKIDQNSNYSKNTSDSQKNYESVSLTTLSIGKFKNEEQVVIQDGKKKELNHAHSLQMKIEHESKQDNIRQQSSDKTGSDLLQEEICGKILANQLSQAVLSKHYFVPQILAQQDKQHWRDLNRLFASTTQLMVNLDSNEIDVSIINKISAQLLKEVNKIIQSQEQSHEKVQLLNLANKLQKCDQFPEQVLSIAPDTLFELIKYLQKLIDKQEMNSSHSKHCQLSKNLALCGNQLILCYKAWPYLSKGSLFLQLKNYLSKQLTSSQQFYIWLYEIQLEQMQLQSK